MQNFLALAVGPAARGLQRERGSDGLYDTESDGLDALSAEEITHLAAAQHFYLASVNEDGWPYVQHRGGDGPGSVRVLGATTIGWVERRGNRQYIGTGNVVANGRVSMIVVDYPTRARLKLLGQATLHRDPDPALLAAVGGDGVRHDGVVTVEVLATSWNCSKFIEPRFTRDQVEAALRPLHERIATLEAELARR